MSEKTIEECKKCRSTTGAEERKCLCSKCPLDHCHRKIDDPDDYLDGYSLGSQDTFEMIQYLCELNSEELADMFGNREWIQDVILDYTFDEIRKIIKNHDAEELCSKAVCDFYDRMRDATEDLEESLREQGCVICSINIKRDNDQGKAITNVSYRKMEVETPSYRGTEPDED